MRFLTVVVAVAVVGCDEQAMHNHPVSVERVVSDKDRRLVVEQELHYDWINGKFRSLPTPKEEFFLFSEDGCRLKVTFEEFHRYKVGDKVSSPKWRQ